MSLLQIHILRWISIHNGLASQWSHPSWNNKRRCDLFCLQLWSPYRPTLWLGMSRLAIENEVDRTYKLNSPKQVKELKIAAYNVLCRTIVMRYAFNFVPLSCPILRLVNTTSIFRIQLWLFLSIWKLIMRLSRWLGLCQAISPFAFILIWKTSKSWIRNIYLTPCIVCTMFWKEYFGQSNSGLCFSWMVKYFHLLLTFIWELLR